MRLLPLLRTAAVSAAAAVTAALAGAGHALADDRPSLVVAVQALPATMEPARELNNVGLRITYNVFDKLVEFDYQQNMKLTGGLATAWNRIDGKTVELTLREGVKLHDGSTMTAEDVAFTFGPERMSSPEAPAYGSTRNYWANLDRVEVTGPMTVRFHMKENDPQVINRLGVWSAEIIGRKAFEAAADWDAWSRAPVGTGPFVVDEIRTNDFIRLKAFDDYWGGRAAVKEVTFKAVPEVAARIAGLASGEYDIITDIPPDQLANIERYDDLEVAGGPILNHRVLIFSQCDKCAPAMRDVNLRRALALAIDRDLIVETLWGGRTKVPAGHQWEQYGDMFLDGIEWTYDPAKARELVKASSYKGEELVYPVVNNYYTNEVATAEILVAMWADVGINVRMEVKENWKQVNATPPDIRNWSNSMPFPDPVAGLWRLWRPAYVSRQGWNWNPPGWAESGAVLDESTDPEARKKAWGEMQAIWMDRDPGGTMLYQNAVFYGKKKSVDWRAYPAQPMDLGPYGLPSVTR